MRKVKLITTLSLTVVMLVMMAGLAMANPENIAITPGNQNIQPGQSISDPTLCSTYTISVTEIIQGNPAGNSHAIWVEDVEVVTGTGLPSDLRYRFHYGGDSTGWVEEGSSLSNNLQWDDGGKTAATLTMDVLDMGTSTDAVYKFKVRDEFQTQWGSDDTGLATAYGSAIPEFTTIAIPVASILGLLFFFNYRKHKKE